MKVTVCFPFGCIISFLVKERCSVAALDEIHFIAKFSLCGVPFSPLIVLSFSLSYNELAMFFFFSLFLSHFNMGFSSKVNYLLLLPFTLIVS